MYLHMLFFRFDARHKKLLVRFHSQVLFFFCLAAMIFSVNTANIQYFWVFLDIQINYNWKSIISLLKYCTLQKTHFALQCWQPYFFMTTPTRNTVYFSYFLAVKYVSLILWLKVYVAFNDLHILKILSVIWMTNKL